MNNRPRRIVNSALAARSTVRLIEALAPPKEDAPANVILKPKEIKRRLPGTSLLIKMQKQREKEKLKKQDQRGSTRVIDPDAVNSALATIFTDLGV